MQPYVIESKNSGFEIDIVKEALSLEDYKAQFIYQPLLRTKFSFKRGDVEAVMTIKPEYPEIKDAFVSKEYITYHNFAITLRSQNFKIITISDLNNKRVQAFQQANFALGKEFEFMAKSNLTYMEQANQQNQIVMLFLKRADALIIDKRIFRYHCNKLKQKQTNDKMFGNITFKDPVVFHDLFEPTSYHMAFKSEIVKDAFDRGLKKIRTSGKYERLIESYLVE